jgi:predicted esterase YcpF (UPF0227 family)
MASRSAK